MVLMKIIHGKTLVWMLYLECFYAKIYSQKDFSIFLSPTTPTAATFSSLPLGGSANGQRDGPLLVSLPDPAPASM